VLIVRNYFSGLNFHPEIKINYINQAIKQWLIDIIPLKNNSWTKCVMDELGVDCGRSRCGRNGSAGRSEGDSIYSTPQPGDPNPATPNPATGQDYIRRRRVKKSMLLKLRPGFLFYTYSIPDNPYSSLWLVQNNYITILLFAHYCVTF
jgi:hypothetical protein